MQMNFDEFIQYVKEYFQDKYGERFKVTVRQVSKNNGVCLNGLTIMESEVKIAPTIYLEEFYRKYQQEESLQNVLDKIEEMYLMGRNNSRIDIDFFSDYEEVKDRIYIKMVNYEKNVIMLEDMPYIRMLDFAIVLYCQVYFENGVQGTINLCHCHLNMWNVPKEDVFLKAMNNSMEQLPYEIKPMKDVISEFIGTPDWMDTETDRKEESVQMYVLSNKERLNGASVFAYPGIWEACAKHLNGNFLVLPSSIHELILIAQDWKQSQPESYFLQMVRDVNREQVMEEEILSDHIYLYDSQNRQLQDYVTKETIAFQE